MGGSQSEVGLEDRRTLLHTDCELPKGQESGQQIPGPGGIRQHRGLRGSGRCGLWAAFLPSHLAYKPGSCWILCLLRLHNSSLNGTGLVTWHCRPSGTGQAGASPLPGTCRML